MNNTKTILLIGRTGNGKSTLANVLLARKDESGNFKEIFGESAGSVSETKKVQIEEFEEEGIKYRIIDTVGIGDTKMTLDQVLRKLALMGYAVKDGLSQILFITDGRMANEAKSTYDLLEKVVFDDNIADYTTIIRTNFAEFWNEKNCKEEEKKMIKRSGEFKDLIERCNRIIYVDNPPVNISIKSAEDIGKNKKYEGLEDLNKKKREVSRKILLDHLKNVCQSYIYKPSNLSALGDVIGDYEEEKEKLKEQKKKGLFKKLKDNVENNSLNKEITKRMLEHIERIDQGLKKKLQEELNELWDKDNNKIANWRFFGKKLSKEEKQASSLKEEKIREEINYIQEKIYRLEGKISSKEKTAQIVQEKLDGTRPRDNWETDTGLKKQIQQVQEEKKEIEEELERVKSKLQSLLQNQEEPMQVQIESSFKK